MQQDHEAELDRLRERLQREFDRERKQYERQLDDKDEQVNSLRREVQQAGSKPDRYNSGGGYGGGGGGGGGLSSRDLDQIKSVLTSQMESKSREVKELQQANVTLNEELAKKTK